MSNILFITVLIGRVLIIALGLLDGELNRSLRSLDGGLRELLVKDSRFFLVFSIGA